jgi:hypothetical protein
MVRFLTQREIARALGIQVHRVAWVIEARGIHPVAAIGPRLGYSEEQAALVKAETAKIDHDRFWKD